MLEFVRGVKGVGIVEGRGSVILRNGLTRKVAHALPASVRQVSAANTLGFLVDEKCERALFGDTLCVCWVSGVEGCRICDQVIEKRSTTGLVSEAALP